jgi:hypothetical protein
MAWDALSFVQAPAVASGELPAYWAGKVFSPNSLKVMAAVYVIIRGLVNWNEKSVHKLLTPKNSAAAP